MRDENSFQEKCKESARDRESVYIFGRRREEEGEIQREFLSKYIESFLCFFYQPFLCYLIAKLERKKKRQ